jgi:small subunit ribosomal protein S18
MAFRTEAPREREYGRERDRERKKTLSGDRLFKKKKCRFCVEKVFYIDYKDVMRLKRNVTERGKIIPRRITGNCSKHQHLLAQAIKRARFIALMPYVAE